MAKRKGTERVKKTHPICSLCRQPLITYFPGQYKAGRTVHIECESFALAMLERAAARRP